MVGQKNVATYMGCVGNDAFGKILLAEAVKDGVNAVYQIHATLKTGTCAVLLVGNHRYIYFIFSCYVLCLLFLISDPFALI